MSIRSIFEWGQQYQEVVGRQVVNEEMVAHTERLHFFGRLAMRTCRVKVRVTGSQFFHVKITSGIYTVGLILIFCDVRREG